MKNMIITIAISVVFSMGLTLGALYIGGSGIVFNSIEKDSVGFAKILFSKKMRDSMQEAQKDVQKDRIAEMRAEQQKKLSAGFDNPKQPSLGEGRAYFGASNAPITIVEYSDFECPFCSRAHETIEQVLQTYKKQVRVLYKHLPLSMHPNARTASEYYEAVAMQGADKAKKFHDHIFKNQRQLTSNTKKLLASAVKAAGANLAKVKRDAKSKKVASIIDADVKEANKFGFQGTPAFLVNGVSLSGAQPFEEFKKVIDRHIEKLN